MINSIDAREREVENIVHRHLLIVSFASPKKAKFVGIVPGQERFAFLYVAISVAVTACVMTYCSIAAFPWWQSLSMLIGCLLVGWAILFSILEVRRLGQTAKERADEALGGSSNPYPSRIVIVEPSTGDPYPHHEDYAGSSGLDQGQLTSQLPDSMPFIDRFLSRGRDKKQKPGN